MFSVLCETFIFLLLANHVQPTIVKTWNTNTNFDNPANWDGGLLPCPNDKVIFPESAEIISFMPKSLSVAELVLPLSGQLVFPKDASLTITGGTAQVSCQGKDVHFVDSTKYWHDSLNWNVTSSTAIHVTPGPNSVIPHAYRVPCNTEHVEFPTGKSFKVRVERKTTVASISVNGQRYDNEEFQALLFGETGKLLFPNSPQMTLTGNECSDPSGCICGNDKPEITSIICSHNPPCPRLECSDPIKPIGHCCQICGACLLIEYDTSFRLEKLMELHRSYLNKDEFRKVQSFTSKSYNNKIQTVFMDGGMETGAAAKVAQNVQASLAEDIKGANSYKIRSAVIYNSYGSHTSPQRGMASGSVVATVLVIALVIAGSAAALYMYRKRRIPGFRFARFDRGSLRMEIHMGTTPHEDLEPEEMTETPAPPPVAAKAFDNPVYGTETFQKEVPKVEVSSPEADFCENPMFMVFEDDAPVLKGNVP